MKTKSLLLLAAAVILCSSTRAQSNRISGGILAGANYSYFHSSDQTSSYSRTYDWKWKFGPAGGVYLNVPLARTVSLEPAALYSEMGSKYDVTDVNGTSKWTQRLGYISVPVPLKINAGPSIALLVGPQFDFLTGASLKDDATDDKTKDKDNFKNFDFALTGGLQVMPNRPVSLSVRYMHGLNNLVEFSTTDPTYNSINKLHNSAVQATLNFRLFGAKEKSLAVTTPEVPLLPEGTPSQSR